VERRGQVRDRCVGTPEPLMQADFVIEVIELLNDAHILLDTSGNGQEQDFRRLVIRSDLVFFDLKLIDSQAHRNFTGCDNELILRNLQVLNDLGKPFVVRVPLVPGITDTDQNLADICNSLVGMPGLLHVNLLPYNKAAGSKYEYAGMEFRPEYEETQALNFNTSFFEQAGIKVVVA
jgi:pyruvate formate lyase activating enzyme